MLLRGRLGEIEQVSKSRSVRDLSKAFLDQSQNIIPQSVAEINRNSFLSPNDHSDNAKEPSPISPNLPRSNMASLKSPQYDSTSSNGLENDENLSEGLHSPVISRYSSSPRIQMSPKPSQGSEETLTKQIVRVTARDKVDHDLVKLINKNLAQGINLIQGKKCMIS
jgi:hypothetical protein